MAKPKQKKKNNEEVISVKLKPFLGMKPGLYLTILYGLILAVILFLLLFVPGLARNGTSVTFSSDPGDASVWVDGAFAGTTPCRIFIEKGDHKLVIRKPYHFSVEEEITVQGRVFGSLFVPKKTERAEVLEIADLDDYLAWVHGEFSGWAHIDNFYPSYQPPPLLSETTAGLFVQNINADDLEAIESFLISSMQGITNSVLLRDYLLALAIYASGGNILSPISLLAVLGSIIELGESEPYLPLWLYQALPPDYRPLVAETDWFSRGLIAAADSSVSTAAVPRTAGGSLSLPGQEFIPLTGGSYLKGIGSLESSAVGESLVFRMLDAGLPVPAAAEVAGFSMLSTEVTKRQYSDFLAENAAWRKENIDSLMDEGTVTEDYLKTWDELSMDAPVTCVSWYAARAYCTWLSTKLPRSLAGYSVRLPREDEWEWAAGAATATGSPVFAGNSRFGPAGVYESGMNALGIFGLSGNVWEWCEDWYYEFPSLH